MTRWVKGLGILTVCMIGVAAVGAAEAPQKKKKTDGPGLFEKLDTNKDMKLSKDEFLKLGDKAKDSTEAKARLEKQFEKLDANSDKFLSRDEFKKFKGPGGDAPKKKKNEN